MRGLPEKFEGRGEVKDFSFIQVKKSDKAYIYEVTDNDNGRKHYEVFKRVEVAESDISRGGKNIHCEAMVLYHKSNSFGLNAWTWRNFDNAVKKFEELSKALP